MIRRASIGRSVIGQFVAQGTGLLVALATFAVLARWLGPERLGSYVKPYSLVNFAGILADFGIGSVVLARSSGDLGALLRRTRTSLGLSTIYALPLAATTALVGWVLFAGDHVARAGALILAPSLVVSALASCYTPIAQFHNKLAILAWTNTITRVLVLATVLASVLTQSSVLVIFSISTVTGVLPLAVAYTVFGRVDLRPSFRLADIRALLHEAAPVSVANALLYAYGRLDALLMAVLSSRFQISQYAAAYRIYQGLGVPTAILTNTVAAPLVKAFSRDRAATARMYDTITRYALVLGGAIVTAGFPLAGTAMGLLGGHPFVGGARTAQLLFVTLFISFTDVGLATLMVAARLNRQLIMLTATSLVANVVLNAIMIPRYGSLGAAIAFVVSEMAGVTLALLSLARGTGLKPAQSSLTFPALSAMTGIALATLLPIGPWWRSALAVGIYLVLLQATRTFTWIDLRAMLSRTGGDRSWA